MFAFSRIAEKLNIRHELQSKERVSHDDALKKLDAELEALIRNRPRALDNDKKLKTPSNVLSPSKVSKRCRHDAINGSPNKIQKGNSTPMRTLSLQVEIKSPRKLNLVFRPLTHPLLEAYSCQGPVIRVFLCQ